MAFRRSHGIVFDVGCTTTKPADRYDSAISSDPSMLDLELFGLNNLDTAYSFRKLTGCFPIIPHFLAGVKR